MIKIALIAAAAAITLPSMGCIVHTHDRRPPPREVIVEHRR